ncbi:MAG: helix-turn-helix transcriptional regulator [Acidobacteria bacterium]|nr:helix-turn-helix transcriptional regulator [Acidobacteriota bacterium]
MSDLCRRCAFPLPTIPKWDPAPAADARPAFRHKTSESVLMAAGRGLGSSDLQLRGKTAREFTIGRRLRELREQRHITQQDMALRAGVPRTYISRIENARLLPGPLMLNRIADALSVGMLDLLPRDGNGNGHLGGAEDSYWAELVRGISCLRSEQLVLVLAHARQLAEEGKAHPQEAQLAAH